MFNLIKKNQQVIFALQVPMLSYNTKMKEKKPKTFVFYVL